MGGDEAPNCTVLGALEALRADKELKITLAGPISEIEKMLNDAGDVRDRIELDDCPDIITNHDAPVMAVRQKKNSAVVFLRINATASSGVHQRASDISSVFNLMGVSSTITIKFSIKISLFNNP